MSMREPLAQACKQWQALKCFPAKQIKAAVYGTCSSSWLDKISHHLFNQSLSWLAHSRSHTWTGYINLFRILIGSFDVRCMLRTITLEKLPNSLGTVTQYSYIFYKFVGALIIQFNLFEKYHAVLPPPTLHHVDAVKLWTMLTLGKTTLFVEWGRAWACLTRAKPDKCKFTKRLLSMIEAITLI